jgi:hypothetical protein
MFAQRAFLIQRLKEKREVVEQLVAKTPPDKEIYIGWKIKELLAHLSGWDDAIVEALGAHARGEPVSRTVSAGINAYNAKTVHIRESLSLEQVIKEWRTKRNWCFRRWKICQMRNSIISLHFRGVSRAQWPISLKFLWNMKSTMPGTTHNGWRIQTRLLANISRQRPDIRGAVLLTRHCECI